MRLLILGLFLAVSSLCAEEAPNPDSPLSGTSVKQTETEINELKQEIEANRKKQEDLRKRLDMAESQRAQHLNFERLQHWAGEQSQQLQRMLNELSEQGEHGKLPFVEQERMKHVSAQLGLCKQITAQKKLESLVKLEQLRQQFHNAQERWEVLTEYKLIKDSQLQHLKNKIKGDEKLMKKYEHIKTMTESIYADKKSYLQAKQEISRKAKSLEQLMGSLRKDLAQ